MLLSLKSAIVSSTILYVPWKSLMLFLIQLKELWLVMNAWNWMNQFPSQDSRILRWLLLVLIVWERYQPSTFQVTWLLINWFDLPQLAVFNTGDDSFYESEAFSMSSMIIADWIIWSSSTYSVHYRRLFIPAS